MSEIAEITAREIALISRFIALLNNEQEILKRAKPADLPEISAAKIDLVEQLNTLEIERRSALGMASDENPRKVMTKWLAQHPAEQAAAVNWKNLLNLASEAKQLHDLNARLVGMHLQQTTEALAILNRQSSEQLPLYGSNGQAAQNSGSRIVDSA